MPRNKRKGKPIEQVPDFTFSEAGLLYAVACSSLSQEEVIGRVPASGTSAGWVLATELPDDVPSNPWPCNDHPDTHKHYLFVC